MRWLILFLLTTSLYCADLDHYLYLMRERPKTLTPLGNYENGEIEIALDIPTILDIESTVKSHLLNKGIPPSLAHDWSRIGVVAEDERLYWIRDGVILPSGDLAAYDRIVWKAGFDGHPAIAIAPFLDKKIIVSLNFRHATRNWEIELIRGACNQGETLREAASRQLKEKTGHLLDDALLLGTLAVDSGLLSSEVPVLFCKAHETSDSLESSSPLALKNFCMTTEQLETAFLQGFWNVHLPDETIRASVRDPFLAYALLHIKLRKWQD